MIIKLHMDIPTHESEQVNQYASDERRSLLKGLCEDYGYPSANCHGEGVELLPEKVTSPWSSGHLEWRGDIQMSVGGLVLELMAFEKEWNSPDRWELVERAVESNNFVEL